MGAPTRSRVAGSPAASRMHWTAGRWWSSRLRDTARRPRSRRRWASAPARSRGCLARRVTAIPAGCSSTSSVRSDAPCQGRRTCLASGSTSPRSEWTRGSRFKRSRALVEGLGLSSTNPLDRSWATRPLMYASRGHGSGGRSGHEPPARNTGTRPRLCGSHRDGDPCTSRVSVGTGLRPERDVLADVGGREWAVVDRDLVGETAAVLGHGAAVVHHAPRCCCGGGPGGRRRGA